jgi:hypothetical protein
MHSVFAIVAFLLPCTLALPTTTEWDGSNLLIPDENGVLQYANTSQIQAHRERRDRLRLEAAKSIRKRDACSDNQYIGSIMPLTCVQFCEHSVDDPVVGDPIKVSADINCDVGDTCDATHSDAVAITESISINIGVNSPSGTDGDAVISAGASFTWSKTQTTTDSWTFHPKNGEHGVAAS